MGDERINRVLAQAGVGSRRAVEQLVRDGRVTVNGIVERSLGRRIGPDDGVAVDGRPLRREPLVHLLLNKPAGVVTTVSDPDGRPTVLDLVRRSERVYPVGRLDAATTGALVLTNDGELANRLMHPRHRVPKTYRATVQGMPGEAALRALRDGVELDGRRTAPARVRVLERGQGRTRLELVLQEGRNRQVRRMCEAVGHPVLALERARYASLDLHGLRRGEWRELAPEEVASLRRAAGIEDGR